MLKKKALYVDFISYSGKRLSGEKRKRKEIIHNKRETKYV